MTLPLVAPALHPAVAEVRSHIDAHWREGVRISDLAARVGLSEYYLIRLFRRAVGVTPYAYLDRLRVSRAQTLLREGVPISRAAYLSGYCDQSHLTRHFKRVVGVTPGRYARAHRAHTPGATALVAPSSESE